MKYRDFFKEDLLPGGKADNSSIKSFDKTQISMGIKTELEHTNDRNKAKEIAMDHLSEDPQYYSKLKKSGLADELKEAFYDDGQQLTTPFPQEFKGEVGVNNKGTKETPNINGIDKQTAPGTVFPEVDKDKSSCGCASPINQETNGATDVEKPPKDPTETDHVTGGMGSTPSNPNIMSKSKSVVEPMTGAGINAGIVPNRLDKLAARRPDLVANQPELFGQDISIDIDESKKILNNLKRWTVKF